MPLDSILRRKERIIKALPTVQNTEARQILAGDMNISGVFDKAVPEGTPVESATVTLGAASIAKGATTTASVAVLPGNATNKNGTWVSTVNRGPRSTRRQGPSRQLA